jgi:ribosome maturation factor RimP
MMKNFDENSPFWFNLTTNPDAICDFSLSRPWSKSSPLETLDSLEAKFWSLAMDVCQQKNLMLYDLTYNARQYLLQVFVYNPLSKTAVIEDCVAVDQALTEPLQESWVPENLVLEVSSPGMYRDIYRLNHYYLALEQRVKFKLKNVTPLKAIFEKEILESVMFFWQEIQTSKSMTGILKGLFTNSAESQVQEDLFQILLRDNLKCRENISDVYVKIEIKLEKSSLTLDLPIDVIKKAILDPPL